MHWGLIPLVFVTMVLMLPSCASGPSSQAIGSSASQPEADEALRIAELRARGESLAREKRYSEALDLFRAAEKINPSDPRLIYDIGTVLRYTGHYKEALSYLRRALDLAPQEPQHFRAYGQIGIIEGEMGNYAAAIEAFRTVLTLKPDNMAAMAYLADLYFKTQQYDLCKQYIALFTKAVNTLSPALLTDDDRRQIRETLDRMGIYMRTIEPQGQGAQSQEKPPEHWGPHFSTPGTELTLREIERVRTDEGTRVAYALEAKGFSEGKIYTLWSKPSGAPPEAYATGFVVDRSGSVLCPGASSSLSEREAKERMKKRQCVTSLDRHKLHAVRYHKGEAYEFALVSMDQTVRGFAKTFPFPLEVREGSCSIQAEFIPPRALGILGEGFVPGEEVSTVSESSGEVLKGSQTVSDEGKLPITIVDPGVKGKRGGAAKYTVVGKSCRLTLEYEWGSESKIQ